VEARGDNDKEADRTALRRGGLRACTDRRRKRAKTHYRVGS